MLCLKIAGYVTNSVDLHETPRLIWVYTVCSGPVRLHTYSKVQHTVRVMLRQTCKIMTKSSVNTYRLSIAKEGLIIDYLFSSD